MPKAVMRLSVLPAANVQQESAGKKMLNGRKVLSSCMQQSPSTTSFTLPCA